MIETRDLTVTYDGRAVLRAVDLTVPDGGHRPYKYAGYPYGGHYRFVRHYYSTRQTARA